MNLKMINLHTRFPVFLLVLFTACARPVAEFSYQGGNIAPAEFTFENKSSKATRYRWDFGDGTFSEEASPLHSYASSGNYVVQLSAFKGHDKDTSLQRLQVVAPADCLVKIETDYGTMIAVLYNGTPLHRDNFIKLADEGFYDGLLFHRIINQFMIQGGDPLSRKAKPGQAIGSGGPGYTIPAEITDTLVHVKGAIAAARTGNDVNPTRASSGSQFYIVQGRTWTDDQLDQNEAQKGFRYTRENRELYKTIGGAAQLDHEYTVFGRVISGLDVIDKIAAAQTTPNDRPAEDIKMKISIIK